MKQTLIFRSKLIIKSYENWLFPADKVLDVGCGNGIVTRELQKKFRCNMAGTDILKYADVDLPFYPITQEDRLPFSDNSFDVAMFNDVLHHTANPDTILKEAARVAKRVLIFEIKPTIIAKMYDVLINKIHNPRMPVPLNLKDQKEWQDLFSELGFSYTTRIVPKPVFYPFTHFAFCVESCKI